MKKKRKKKNQGDSTTPLKLKHSCGYPEGRNHSNSLENDEMYLSDGEWPLQAGIFFFFTLGGDA